jgi:hypothetical protein
MRAFPIPIAYFIEPQWPMTGDRRLTLGLVDD